MTLLFLHIETLRTIIPLFSSTLSLNFFRFICPIKAVYHRINLNIWMIY